MKRAYSLALLLAACSDPLIEPQEIMDTRALGVRLATAEDVAVMSVSPGQKARVSLLIASRRPQRLAAIVSFCAAKPITLGTPECEGEAFETKFVEGDSGTDLVVPFVLNPDLNTGDEWMVRASVCDDAQVVGTVALAASCSNGEPPLELFYRTTVSGNAVNHNPNLGDDELLLNGKVWAEAPKAKGCEDGMRPELSAAKGGEITFQLRGDDREVLPASDGATRESLLFSHATDAPGLSRAFSVIEQDATTKSFDLSFKPEAASSKRQARLVTFYLIARDERGGTDWLSRQFCLVD